MELQPPAAALTAGVLMLICYTADPVDDDVRLVGGSSRCAGTVEVFHTGDWWKVSANYWSMRDAAVACRQLDCGSAVAATARELSDTEVEWGVRIGCRGTEPTLKECMNKYDDVIQLSAEVICSDSVRLLDGAGHCSGRVEVKPHQSWTTVCDADFDWQDAEVVCRELGCGSPLTVKGALLGEKKHPFGNKEFQCKGTEDHLLDCSTSRKKYTCTRGNAVGLTCSEPDYVRLVDGSSRCAGTVEMFHTGVWRRVTAFEWSITMAALVCRELDCGSAVAVTERLIKNKAGWSVEIYCDGSESALSKCRKSLVQHATYRAEVICSDSVRLVDGAEFCSGRVEVKSHQSWTTVCEADFDWKDAEVVCRELDCGPPLTLQGALFGEGTLPFGTKELHCEGTEDRLLTCSTSDREEQTCTGGNAVGLTCAEARLVGESSRCAGTVETFHSGGWRRVKAYVWTLMEAYVVCRVLDCGSAVAAIYRMSDETGWGVGINCEDDVSALRKCLISNITFLTTDAVGICSGLLEQPTISFSTPINVSRSPIGSKVFRGENFTITCSTQPQYPGGTFHLKLPWNNRSYTQPAANHSAYFFFPAADDSHQGDYSCVYENQVYFQNEPTLFQEDYTGNFSSESEPLFITVTGSSLPAVITRMLLVPFLMLTTCLSVYLILKKWGHVFIKNTSGQQGAAEAAVQHENIELVSQQSRAEEEQQEEEKQDRN